MSREQHHRRRTLGSDSPLAFVVIGALDLPGVNLNDLQPPSMCRLPSTAGKWCLVEAAACAYHAGMTEAAKAVVSSTSSHRGALG